jgi:hypothetical protein
MSTVATQPDQVKSHMKDQKPAEGLVQQPRVVEGEIVDASAYNVQVAGWQGRGFSVLTPAASLSSIPRDHKILVQQVKINPDPASGEVYTNPLFTRNGEVALSKSGLEKVAQAAGITIDDIQRVDDRKLPHVYTYRVTGHWLGFDGNVIARIAHKTLDLRDGSVDLKGFKENQIEQARRHGEAVCESKAINRLYRQYGLRQKYTQRELSERPFIVLKLQWEPDMKNPVVAAIVTQMKMGATQLLYPQGMPGAVDTTDLPAHQLPPALRQSLPRDVDDEDDDPPVTKAATGKVSDFTDDEPADDTAKPLNVVHVGENEARTDYYVTIEGGQILHTKDRAVAKACAAAMKAQQPIAIEFDGAAEILEVGGGKY